MEGGQPNDSRNTALIEGFLEKAEDFGAELQVCFHYYYGAEPHAPTAFDTPGEMILCEDSLPQSQLST